MRIVSIAVKGLFGLFNHEVPLQSAERVTIIHGPNGFGKTAILRMIAALIQGKKEIFEQTPFSEFSITLDDGSSRIIRRFVDTPPGTELQVRLEYLVRATSGHDAIPAEPLPTLEIPRSILTQVDRLVPSPYRVSGTGWSDGTRTFTLEQILKLFPEAIKGLPEEYRPGLIFDVCRILQVFFVETNRLVAEPSTQRQPAFFGGNNPSYAPHQTAEQPQNPRVKHYSDDIVQRIRTVLTEYARHSQERDRTFPERLVRFVREGSTKLSEREILGRMTELEEKRQRLISFGLLDSERGLSDLTEEDVRRSAEALTIYVGDIEEKLKVFDDLSRRIGALVDIINSRFTYKRLIINRQRGFRVITDLETPIGLADLSSGEQHEIIVLYELLFRCPENGLVLVDEPEISLHVAWQSRFLTDLIKILEPTGAYALVATHSPVVIGARRDLTVELKGPHRPAREV